MSIRTASDPAQRPRPWWRWGLLSAYGLMLLGLSLAARDPAWSAWFDPQALAVRAQALLAWPMGPLAVVGAYVLLVLMAVPVLALIVMGAAVFGPWPGMAYSLVGMVAGATVAFAFGRCTGAQAMDRLTQGRLGLLDKHLHQRGLLTVALVRFLPMAPFMVVNLVAGALRIRLRDFVLGSALGLLPGTVLISLFTERLLQAWQSRDVPVAVWVGLAAAAMVACGGWWVRRRRAAGKA